MYVTVLDADGEGNIPQELKINLPLGFSTHKTDSAQTVVHSLVSSIQDTNDDLNYVMGKARQNYPIEGSTANRGLLKYECAPSKIEMLSINSSFMILILM